MENSIVNLPGTQNIWQVQQGRYQSMTLELFLLDQAQNFPTNTCKQLGPQHKEQQ